MKKQQTFIDPLTASPSTIKRILKATAKQYGVSYEQLLDDKDEQEILLEFAYNNITTKSDLYSAEFRIREHYETKIKNNEPYKHYLISNYMMVLSVVSEVTKKFKE